MCDFENRVLKGLAACNIDLTANQDVRLGAAVSGGADSVSLLYSLSNICKKYNLPLFVITVNHNIREEAETTGDAIFVEKLCKNIAKEGMEINCEIVEIPRGKINELAAERKNGIEEAARFLRYEAFDDFIIKNKLSALCIAHNKDDQIETLLMRFLQGSSCDSAGGIKCTRDKFARPLLDISRSEIEQYLTELNVNWRTDSTNADTSYYRNKIRNNLIPFLNTQFSGWQQAVLAGGEKAAADGELINKLVEEFPLKYKDNVCSFLVTDFSKSAESVQSRLILKACNLCGEKRRIPYAFVKEIMKLCNTNTEFNKRFDEIEISLKKNTLFVKKWVKIHTDLVFFDIIEESGEYTFPFGTLIVEKDSDENAKLYINQKLCKGIVEFPFYIRSIQLDDYIESADGKLKKVSDIFSDWHVLEEHKNLIPIIETFSAPQSLICIYAGFLGYKDWIVK